MLQLMFLEAPGKSNYYKKTLVIKIALKENFPVIEYQRSRERGESSFYQLIETDQNFNLKTFSQD